MQQNGIVLLLAGIVIIAVGVFFFSENVRPPLFKSVTSDAEDTQKSDESQQKEIKPSGNTPEQPKTAPFPQSGISGGGEVYGAVVNGEATVAYTDSGFVPSEIILHAGDLIHFVNKSSRPMWVTSRHIPNAGENAYTGLDMERSVPTGGVYTFAFTLVGAWQYKNLNSENDRGVVIVLEQE